mmetsp:Transcript_1366/g.3039  ORF Transcript_1366/g.3039 Transcript_1366/m.3039 type:complete len:442 (+) Transcript_1366:430-1755(+)
MSARHIGHVRHVGNCPTSASDAAQTGCDGPLVASQTTLFHRDWIFSLELLNFFESLLWRVTLGHENHGVGGHAVLRPSDLLASLNTDLGPDDILSGGDLGQVRDFIDDARELGVCAIVGDASQRCLSNDGASWDPQRCEDALFHEVHAPNSAIDFVDRPSTHSGIHFDELRPCGRVLALDVEDAVLEIHCLQNLDGQVHQLFLLPFRQHHRRADAPRFVEPRLDCGAIVCKSTIFGFTIRQNDVDVNLIAVQPLLHEDRCGHDLRRLDAGDVAGRATKRHAAHAHGLSQLGNDFGPNFLHLLDAANLHDTLRGCAGHGLHDCWEFDDFGGDVEVVLGVDEEGSGCRQLRATKAVASGVLISSHGDGGGVVPRQSQLLAQLGDDRAGHVDQSHDALGLSGDTIIAEGAKDLQTLIDNLVGRSTHVHVDELADDTLLQKALCP